MRSRASNVASQARAAEPPSYRAPDHPAKNAVMQRHIETILRLEHEGKVLQIDVKNLRTTLDTPLRSHAVAGVSQHVCVCLGPVLASHAMRGRTCSLSECILTQTCSLCQAPSSCSCTQDMNRRISEMTRPMRPLPRRALLLPCAWPPPPLPV